MARKAQNEKLYSGNIEDFNGYIKVPRIILYYLLMGDSSDWRAGAFADLMNLLTCKPSIDKITKRHQIRLTENEKRLTYGMLAKRWGVSPGSIRYFMRQLVDCGTISKRTVTVGTKEHCVWKRTDMSHSTTTSTTTNPTGATKTTDNQVVKKTTSTITNTSTSTQTSTNIMSLLSSSNKEENFDKKEENETTPRKTYLQVWEEKKKEFLNFLKMDEGKLTWDLMIKEDSRIMEKGYSQKEMLQEIHNMFVRWLKSNIHAERKRLHDSNRNKVGHLQNWLTSHYRKSKKQVEQQKKRKSKDQNLAELYPVEAAYSEARYNQLYSLLDNQRKVVITDIFKREGKNRAFRTLKEYCISENLIDAA